MKLSMPKTNTFYASLVLVVLAIIGSFVTIPFVSEYAFWIAVIGYVVLMLGNTMSDF
jgi:hypothetical protein